ncbi:unnamed protein product [Blepharisma stoltei]|uniref:Ferritin-like domain-containing protein n=1 Tax=Blepharisma stoltei TaxID=1481888 RepID=A0AAU9IDJ0_9CILI|nr:unnamed protein product [Blepharisma stoltei]
MSHTIRQIVSGILKAPDLATKLSLSRQGFEQIKTNKLQLGEKVENEWVFPENLEFINPFTAKPKLKIPLEHSLLHSAAYIELMAIFMYWDTLSIPDAPYEFYHDFAQIASEESHHFGLIITRMESLGYSFPSIPCNDALYFYSKKTSADICARIVLTSLFSEGRALDSHDRLINKLKSSNTDKTSALLLSKIISEEVSHVKIGLKWFLHFAGDNPKEVYKSVLSAFKLQIRPPFNTKLRDAAGFPQSWYLE